jgi:hypothetical protein
VVAVLKVPRQRSHRVEVAWQVETDKTQFHRYSRCGSGSVDRDSLAACCLLGVLELSTLDTRRFLFRLPESFSRWLDQDSLDFARSAAKRTARFCKLRTESVLGRLPEVRSHRPAKAAGPPGSAQGVEWV